MHSASTVTTLPNPLSTKRPGEVPNLVLRALDKVRVGDLTKC